MLTVADPYAHGTPRRSHAEIDRLLADVREMHPEAASIVLAWVPDDGPYILELRSDGGARVPIGPRTLALLSSRVRSVSRESLRLGYPDGEEGRLAIPVDEPAWARALDSAAGRIEAGYAVPRDELHDAAALALAAASGAVPQVVRMQRTRTFTATPGDVVFEPTDLPSMPGFAEQALRRVLDALAETAQRADPSTVLAVVEVRL